MGVPSRMVGDIGFFGSVKELAKEHNKEIVEIEAELIDTSLSATWNWLGKNDFTPVSETFFYKA